MAKYSNKEKNTYYFGAGFEAGLRMRDKNVGDEYVKVKKTMDPKLKQSFENGSQITSKVKGNISRLYLFNNKKRGE